MADINNIGEVLYSAGVGNHSFDSAGNRLVVGDGRNVSLYDETGTRLALFTGDTLAGSAYCCMRGSNQVLFRSNAGSGTFKLYSALTPYALVSTIVTAAASGVVASDGTDFYTSNSLTHVSKFNSSGTVLWAVNHGASVTALRYIAPYLYGIKSSGGAYSLLEINTTTGAVVTTVVMPSAPSFIQFTQGHFYSNSVVLGVTYIDQADAFFTETVDYSVAAGISFAGGLFYSPYFGGWFTPTVDRYIQLGGFPSTGAKIIQSAGGVRVGILGSFIIGGV